MWVVVLPRPTEPELLRRLGPVGRTLIGPRPGRDRARPLRLPGEAWGAAMEAEEKIGLEAFIRPLDRQAVK